MHAAILFVAIVAVGDTPDYIPAAGGAVRNQTQNRTADFNQATRSHRQFGESAANRQRQIDREVQSARSAIPKPLRYGGDFVTRNPVRTANTDSFNNSLGKVRQTAQFELNEPQTGVAKTQLTQGTSPRKRYIPANAGSEYQPGTAKNNLDLPTRPNQQLISNDTDRPRGV